MTRIAASSLAILIGIASFASPHALLYVLVVLLALYALGMTPLVATALVLILSPLRALVVTEASSLADPTFPLLLLFVGTYFTHSIINRQGLLPRLSVVHIALILFILILGLSVVSSTSISAWLMEWMKWWLALVSALIVATQANYWRWLLFILVVSAFANALVGIFIFFGGSGADHLLILDRYYRAFGTFGQPNPFGGFMGLVLPISLCLFYGYTKYAKQETSSALLAAFYAIVSVILLFALIASWSRGAWLSSLIAFGVVLLAIPRTLKHRLFVVVAILAILLSVWAGNLIPQSILDRLSTSFADLFILQDVTGVDITAQNYAVIERLAHWQAAIRMAQHSPWLGVGLGNYEIAYPQFSLLNWPQPLGHAHNYYLHLLSETGIIGLAAYFLLWLALLALTWQAQKNLDPLKRMASIGLLGSWSYLLAHSLLDNLFVNNLFIHLGIMFGVLAILHRQAVQKIDWMYQ